MAINQNIRKHNALSSFLKLCVALSLFVAIIFGITHTQDIKDWWSLRNYTPPASISNLADETTMTATARKYFYVNHPEIQDREEFNQNCKVNAEKTIVLGCYVSGSQRIYIFNVNDNKLNGVEEVTAAHEMLHSAYEHLDSNKKAEVNDLLKQQMTLLSNDSHLQDLIAIYNKQEPGQLLNEMHSIIGTEYGRLIPQLESYYAQYFTNRQSVVTYASGYKQVFNQMKTQLSQTETLLKSLKQSISQMEATIDVQKRNLEARYSQLNSLRQNDAAAYNTQVSSYNAMVDDYNTTIARYKNLINQYNDLVKSHNSIAIDYNNLSHELDSNYSTIDQ